MDQKWDPANEHTSLYLYKMHVHIHSLTNNTTHSSLYVCVQYKDKKQMIELTCRFMEQGGLVVIAKCFSSLHP